ncbi:threonine/serine exporter family protein [Lacticaseibacillus thailandensis]|nr:threonine/serine exporter family protein [Lacticaseibacillus thailandensis]
MNLVNLFIEVAFGFLSSVGFGIITNVPRRTLMASGVTGGLAWGVYVLVDQVAGNVILPNLLAALTIGVLANVAAIAVRAPVNVMYVPCLVSLVPGAIIYMSMKNFTLGHDASAQQGLIKTLTVAFALAIGFVLAEALMNQVRPWIQRLLHREVSQRR